MSAASPSATSVPHAAHVLTVFATSRVAADEKKLKKTFFLLLFFESE
jgi:hypothetical protein